MTNSQHQHAGAPPQFPSLHQPVQFPQHAYNPHNPPNHHPTQLSPRNSHPELRLKPHGAPNYTTSSASSIQRSPSISTRSSFSNTSTPVVNKRHSFSDPAPAPSPSVSSEHIIDLMEREQDAIVLKLMKEIETLKQENKSLRTNGGSVSSAASAAGASLVRRSSSLSSHRNSISSVSSAVSQSAQQSPAAPPPPTNKRNSALFTNYSVASASPNDDMYKKFKSASIDAGEPRDPSPTSKHPTRSRAGSAVPYDVVCEENKHLRSELVRLRHEIDAMKRYKDI